jgi:hypothetical protein
MKMQDVITKLREEAPLLDKCSKNVDAVFNKAWGLFDDFRRAESDAGRMLLADAVCSALNEFAKEYRTLRCSIETVCLMNAEYKEKIGPRTKKPKGDERQQELPGLGDEGGSPATIGETPSFMQSGRHG